MAKRHPWHSFASFVVIDVKAKFRRTRALLEELHGSGIRLSIATKSDLVWLENLNLRGDYKAHILAWVHKRHPELDPLYDAIYRRGDRTYWSELDARLRKFAATEDLPYLRAEDNRMADFGEPPIVVNYFYHEQVKKSARV